jgi:hypothetical protein|nr:MAG TPA: hypothetical protein [Caudoviricetes sp.]
MSISDAAKLARYDEPSGTLKFVRAIEAKLKEKNT